MNLREKSRPYLTVNDFYQAKFQTKVFKIALNGNFTCPNRDGKLSREGCLFCSESGSGDFAGDKELSLQEQFTQVRQMMESKWHDGKYIVYFQANTNTYAPLEVLKSPEFCSAARE